MSYKPVNNFRVKDTLGPNDPNKIIYGADLQDEFDEISKSTQEIDNRVDGIASKDTVTDVPNDGVMYGRKNKHWQRLYIEQPGVTEDAPNDGKTYGRKNEAWSEVSSGGGSDYDDTQIKSDLATETQARIDGDTALDLRIDTVEESITDGGGFVDAPNDGKLYGRQSEAWLEVVIPDVDAPDWADITSKPTEFTPSAHSHVLSDVTGLEDALTNVDATSVKAGAFIETVTDATYAGVDATVDLSLANNFAVDFSQLGSFTLGLAGAPSGAGDAYGCTLTVDTANMTALTWDAKVKWPGGSAPALAADSTYVFTLMTTDGGTTFKGFVGGEAFA